MPDVPWICAACGEEIHGGEVHSVVPVNGIPRVYHGPGCPESWQRQAYREMYERLKLRGVADPFFNRIVRSRRNG